MLKGILLFFLSISVCFAYKCGTAFPINGEGYFITAAHVLSNGAEVDIYTKKKGILKAEYYITDTAIDTGVFYVPDYTSKYLKLSKNQGPYPVALYGYPKPDIYGSNLKVAEGTGEIEFSVVLLRQSISFNANIWPGNSGGPVVNNKGVVVGTSTHSLMFYSTLPNGGSTQGLGTPTESLTKLLDRHKIKYTLVNDTNYPSIVFQDFKDYVEREDLSVRVCVTEKQ